MRINADKIREYREAHGISIDEMAEILNIEGEALYEYESGIPWYEHDALTIFIINSICDDLDFIKLDMNDIYKEYFNSVK